MVQGIAIYVGCNLLDGKTTESARSGNIADHCCPANDLRPADKPFFIRELHGNLACRDLNGNWS